MIYPASKSRSWSKANHSRNKDDDLDEEESTVTRYVEAVAEEEFAIGFTLEPDFKYKCYSIAFRVYADGKLADAPIMRKKRNDRTRTSYGAIEADWRVRKYRFAAIETGMLPSIIVTHKMTNSAVSDGKIKDAGLDEAKSCGTIKIECVYILVLRNGKYRMPEALENSAGIMLEKALKGRSISQSVE
jgi:hypothetical protein